MFGLFNKALAKQILYFSPPDKLLPDSLKTVSTPLSESKTLLFNFTTDRVSFNASRSLMVFLKNHSILIYLKPTLTQFYDLFILETLNQLDGYLFQKVVIQLINQKQLDVN